VLATRQLAARPAFAVLQVSALAVGLLALVLLVLLRTDLIAAWRHATPPDAPNRFVINMQPEQGEAFRKQLTDAGVAALRLVPDDPRPAGGHQRPAVTVRAAYATTARSAWSSASSTSATPTQLPAHNQLAGGRWTPTRPMR
jgi:putative ABC transport system permease protein